MTPGTTKVRVAWQNVNFPCRVSAVVGSTGRRISQYHQASLGQGAAQNADSTQTVNSLIVTQSALSPGAIFPIRHPGKQHELFPQGTDAF